MKVNSIGNTRVQNTTTSEPVFDGPLNIIILSSSWEKFGFVWF